MLTTNQNLQQGRYRIVSQIKQNGAEASYEAFDNELGTQVLVKEIRSSLGKVATPAQVEAQALNFAEKAKILTEIKHESLLVVRDFFSETDNHYLITEFPGGNTFGELMEKNKKPFAAGEVADWANDLLGALNYLHTQQMPPIIHGEVKPQNIRLSADGKKAKLVISNLVKSADEIKAATRNQTFDAAVLPFLALEQIWQGLDSASKKVILTNYDDKSEKILEQPADARTDLFSLAASLYYLLTAQAPADALTRSIDILEGKADPLQSPTRLNPAVPQEVSDVLLKALEIRRENRFSSAVIMRQVLRTAFVRVQERHGKSEATASPAKEDDFLLEIPVAETKPSVPAPAPKNLEMESEQARQLELIKRKLREAEEHRLEAERRAAEAEKRLLEAEKTIHETPTTISLSADEMKKETSAVTSAYQPASDDLPSLFAEAPKESGGFKKIAVAAIALIALGGGGFGIWTVTQSKSGAPNPAAVNSINSDISNSPAENKPAAAVNTESTPPTNEQAATTTDQDSQSGETPAATTGTENPAENPALAKPKQRVVPTTAPQVAEVKKPVPTPVKKAETPKKVTLDDLLKDN